jgi:hypothetical protein
LPHRLDAGLLRIERLLQRPQGLLRNAVAAVVVFAAVRAMGVRVGVSFHFFGHEHCLHSTTRDA